MTYEETINFLFSSLPLYHKTGSAAYKPGLQNIEALDNLCGNPHNRYLTIHVAGSNGKGSVSHTLASVLQSSGLKTGLYTSPHLKDFRERIRVDGEMIPEERVVAFTERLMDKVKDLSPSFFEWTTEMAFDYFARTKVDAAVIETGLGGRLDSTNIIVPQLSIITSIGLDHKDILGDTIEQIAFEKSGIIKPGVPVVIGDMPSEAEAVMVSAAGDKGCRLYHAGELCEGCIGPEKIAAKADLRSASQVKNIRTVMTALQLLGAGTVTAGGRMTEAIIHAASVTGLRGRWERLCGSPEVICDIGHNVQALSETMPQLVREAEGRRLIMVYGMAGDKDVEAVSRLLPLDATYIFTQAQGSRAMSAGILREIVNASRRAMGKTDAGLADSAVVPDVREAVGKALKEAGEKDLVFIGGSSYVVAEALECFM